MYKILTPIAWIYSAVMAFRNFLFDRGWLKEHTFDIPLISVGNLAVGGTGKTPHTEYILDLLNEEGAKCGMLSRGYGRSTKGFLEVAGESADRVGDEPLQVQQNCRSAYVCVCEDRCHGISRMLASGRRLDAIVLDDAYQHRHVKPGLSLLLTDYSRLYCDDAVMPAGRLRESRSGAKRADLIVVTKCPETLTQEEQANIRKRLAPLPRQQVFFSKISYGPIYNGFQEGVLLTHGTNANAPICDMKRLNALLVIGIARPEPFIRHFEKECASVETLTYPDHHRFSESDIREMAVKAEKADILLTTEKDAKRLACHDLPHEIKKKLCIQPIRLEFLNDTAPLFNQIITHYVKTHPRNRSVDSATH